MLWAGDSRVYRWRSGAPRAAHARPQCGGSGSDHRTADLECHHAGRGRRAALRLDVERDDVRAGDRFLLCSDGLTRIIPDAQIDEWMRHADIRLAVDGLIKATLDAGAPDNVTVVIVEAYE